MDTITINPDETLERAEKFANYLVEEVLSELPGPIKIQAMNIAYDILRKKVSKEVQEAERFLKQKNAEYEAFVFMPKKA